MCVSMYKKKRIKRLQMRLVNLVTAPVGEFCSQIQSRYVAGLFPILLQMKMNYCCWLIATSVILLYAYNDKVSCILYDEEYYGGVYRDTEQKRCLQ